MNYRHIYHAGNICDVAKHAALTLLVARLKAKDTPFCVIDTHAGAGLYDLADERAAKTNEARRGILKLLAAAPIAELAEYYSVISGLKRDEAQNSPAESRTPDADPRLYPGSPLLLCHLLRAQDRLIACELHPEDADALKRNLRRFRQAQLHHRDGYEALGALLPPAEKRGIVLIDPPFEQPDEFARLAEAATSGARRWPQGCFMLWYPVKERPAIWRFHESLAASGLANILAAEFLYDEEARGDRLIGSGLVFINAPWKFDEELAALFAGLRAAQGLPARGGGMSWLAEKA